MSDDPNATRISASFEEEPKMEFGGEEPKNNRNMIIAVIAVVVLCCCCSTAAAAYWAFTSGSFNF